MPLITLCCKSGYHLLTSLVKKSWSSAAYLRRSGANVAGICDSTQHVLLKRSLDSGLIPRVISASLSSHTVASTRILWLSLLSCHEHACVVHAFALLLDGSRPTTDDNERQQPRPFCLRNEGIRGPLEALEQAVADVAGVTKLLQEEHVVLLTIHNNTTQHTKRHARTTHKREGVGEAMKVIPDIDICGSFCCRGWRWSRKSESACTSLDTYKYVVTKNCPVFSHHGGVCSARNRIIHGLLFFNNCGPEPSLSQASC